MVIHQTYLLLLFMLVPLTVSAQPSLPDLPEPVSNNAVAAVHTSQSLYLLSFMGLGSGKTFKDIHNKVWSLQPGDSHWQARQPVPSSLPLKGRLAGIAVGIKNKAYIFGGYTVAEDHSEITSPDNFVYDVLSDRYQDIATTPVPVDDTVALVYRQRYVYLVSGWHNDGNVRLVQLYDAHNNQWQQATPFPGVPVFGHAGGMVNNRMMICDGVGVQTGPGQRRRFIPEAACYSGTVDPERPDKIAWQAVPHPTGKARYRMAAAAIPSPRAGIVFVGGSHTPYNYNGMGYDNNPSTPDKGLWYYNFNRQRWQTGTVNTATMDHRGLPRLDKNTLVIIGGMRNQQVVSAKVNMISTSILSP